MAANFGKYIRSVKIFDKRNFEHKEYYIKLCVGLLVLSVLLRGFIQSRDTSWVDMKKTMILHIQFFYNLLRYKESNQFGKLNGVTEKKLNLQCWQEQSGTPPPPPQGNKGLSGFIMSSHGPL